MSKKEIKFGNDVLKSISKGVEILAKTVGSTLGPGGRNVIFDNYGWPLVTKDGVTVARQIELDDKWENIGAQMVKQVANKTCEDAGDGTTTATILADAILREGIKAISFGNYNPIEVQRGITKSVDIVIDYIEKNFKRDVDNDDRLREIARVSANWDDELGNFVADAVINVGRNGKVFVDESNHYETSLKITPGITFDRGLRSAHFINNESKQICEMTNPYILLYRGDIHNSEDLMPLFREVKKNNASIFIIADNFDDTVLSCCAINKVRNGLNVACIKAPHFNDMRDGTMRDLAVLLNTEYFDAATGTDLEDISLKELGKCDKIISTIKHTTLLGFSNCDKQAKEERIEELRALANDKEAHEIVSGNALLRIHQMNAMSATICIGASSDVEFKEKKDRVDDALHAVRAAMEEGIVPGGGYSYVKAHKCKELVSLSKNIDADGVGAQIVRQALLVPFKKLLLNAGLEDLTTDIMKKIWKNNEKGYNVKARRFENLLKGGVIDPWTVTKSALRNAASVAGLMITSEAIVAEQEEKNSPQMIQQSSIPNLFG